MNVILMHGKNTNPNMKWYPWLGSKMAEYKIKFSVPFLPKDRDPDVEEWIDELEKTCPNEDTILVGHSRGGVAILRWLERASQNTAVKKVILVATNASSIEDEKKIASSKGFYSENAYDFKKIKEHCSDFVVIHSKDDEWVPYASGIENAEGLGAKFLQFTDRGHFGSRLPKQEIPELLDEILER